MTRYVPRSLRDDGMIEAEDIAHYKHLSGLKKYVLAAEAEAEIARLQAENERMKQDKCFRL